MGGVVKNEAEAFESIEAPLAKITAQFTAVEQSHTERLAGQLAENAELHLNLHLLEAGRAFAKEVRTMMYPLAALCCVYKTAFTTEAVHSPNPTGLG